MTGAMPVPLVPEEIEEAAIVARADEDVRAALSDAGLDPDLALANGLRPARPAPTRRARSTGACASSSPACATRCPSFP